MYEIIIGLTATDRVPSSIAACLIHCSVGSGKDRVGSTTTALDVGTRPPVDVIGARAATQPIVSSEALQDVVPTQTGDYIGTFCSDQSI
jgi:hypothetical protein